MIHRRSKISRLPEAAVNQINEFLDANLEYSRIIDWLNQQGHHGIEPYHISRWRDTGYQDWLQSQEDLDQIERKLRWAEKQAEQGTGSSLHRAAMAVIAMKLYDAFNRADSTDINKMLESKPEKIATLINSFARYSREVLEQERFQDHVQERARAEKAAKQPRERISDDARRKVFEELRVALQLPAGSVPAPATEPQKIAQPETQNPPDFAPVST
jgi:hypothetical protein